jgi:sigma-B regulation protein RsbU (phosphoserine phosphatase)
LGVLVVEVSLLSATELFFSGFLQVIFFWRPMGTKAEIGVKKEGAVDVVYVGRGGEVPKEMVSWFEDAGVKWSVMGLDEFIGGGFERLVIGTAAIDVGGLDDKSYGAFSRAVRSISGKGCAVVMLGGDVGGFEDEPLVVQVDGACGRAEAVIGAHLRHKRYCEQRCGGAGKGSEIGEQLRLASEVQRSFLPSVLPDNKRLRWKVIYRPADWVSGDIYDVRRLDEQHVGFYVADAVGHSVPAALLTMFIKQAIVMRETFGDDYRIFGPGEVIAGLNRRMCEQNVGGSLFVTCFYGLLNIRTMQLSFSRGGHPYPVLLRRGSEPVCLESGGSLLGVFDEAQFGQGVSGLVRGDKVVVYSDGAEGVIGDCDDDGRFGFSDTFRELGELGIDEMFSRLEGVLSARKTDEAERDDITVVGLEVV